MCKNKKNIKIVRALSDFNSENMHTARLNANAPLTLKCHMLKVITAIHLISLSVCICKLRKGICVLLWHIKVDVNHLEAELAFPSAKTSITQVFSAEGQIATASRCVKT